MQVVLKATGASFETISKAPIPIDLADQATLKDVLVYVDQHLTDWFPEYLWNHKECRFRGPVVISIDGKITTDVRTRLKDGQEIQIVVAFVGG